MIKRDRQKKVSTHHRILDLEKDQIPRLLLLFKRMKKDVNNSADLPNKATFPSIFLKNPLYMVCSRIIFFSFLPMPLIT